MSQSLDDQFNLRKRHPIGRWHLLCNKIQSAWTRSTLKASLDVSYGDSAGQKLDIFPAANPNAPVFFFIHGGYFRALDKRQYSYMARPLVASGFTVVTINYDLCPIVTVDTIVTQCIRAFHWVYEHITSWNGDPNHTIICGHSVGAFLAAKILEKENASIRKNPISGAMLLSGLYDLGPVQKSYLNESLKLSKSEARELSLVSTRMANLPSTFIAVGENETEEFINQSTHFARKLTAEGHNPELAILTRKNHYTVSRMLAYKGSDLIKKVIELKNS